MSNDSTATQARFTRRGVLTKTAAGIGTAAAVSAGMEQSDVSGPVGEADAALCGGLCIAGAAVGVAAGGAAIGYLASEAADKYLGDTRDYSDYTGGSALKTEVRTGAADMAVANEKVMTSVSNNVTTSENVALAKGKAAMVEAMNAEKTQSAADSDVAAAVDGYYSTIQENILTHWNSQVSQFKHMIERLEAHADVSKYHGDTFAHGPAGGETSGIHSDSSRVAWPTTDVSLLDGTTISVNDMTFPDGSSTEITHSLDIAQGSGDSIWIDPTQYGVSSYDGPVTELFDLPLFNGLLSDIQTKRDNVVSTLSGITADVYSNWSVGEIPTADLVDPITAATELKQNYDGEQAQGAYASMLGIPTSAEKSVWMTLENDGVDIIGDIFTEYVPTDGSGNEVGFSAGNTYDPANFTEPVYVAYEADGSQGETTTETSTSTDTETATDTFNEPTDTNRVSDFVQIEQPFTIHKIETPDGSTVDSFQTTSRNTQTADVSKLQEELDQIRETQIAIQEEAQEEVSGTGGGGGGFLSGSSNRELGILGLGAAALVYLLGQN